MSEMPRNSFGPYDRFVEWLPTELVMKFREYDREDGDADYLGGLTEKIKQEGVKEPLLLEYSRSTKAALLTEGNHRLAVAVRLGWPEVPVRVYRREGAFNRGTGVPVPGFDETPYWNENYKREITPHVPADMKPSDIGVGPYVKKTAAAPAPAQAPARDITQTPQFKAWFSGSEVVDKQGRPLVMFHATQSDIGEFHAYTHFGTQSAANDRHDNLWDFYNNQLKNPARAQGSNIMPVYLSVKNPLRMVDLASIDTDGNPMNNEPLGEDEDPDDDDNRQWSRTWEDENAIAMTLYEMGIMNIDEYEENYYNKDAFKFLEQQGYDGIVYKNTVEDPGNDSWIVFRPNQIKSAVGNSGQFSGGNSITAAKKRPMDVTQTPQFKAWFGRSEVVDKAGKPLRVYHGTKNDFDCFETEVGLIFFTSDPKFASMYAGSEQYSQKNGIIPRDTAEVGANVVPVYLKCEKLFDYRRMGRGVAQDFWDYGTWLEDWEIERCASDYYECGYDELTPEQREGFNAEQFAELVAKGSWVAIEINSFIDFLRNQGFDGIVLLELGVVNYAVFKANQIKSSVGNAEFDGNSNSITAHDYDEDAEYKEGTNGWALNPDQREGNVTNAPILAASSVVSYPLGIIEVLVPQELVLGKIAIAEDDLAGDGIEDEPHITIGLLK